MGSGRKRRGLSFWLAVTVALLLALGLVSAGCGGGDEGEEGDGQASKGVVKIGVLAPLTGDSAADGEDYVKGAELAVKELNASGGVAGYTFEVVSADVKNQVPDAVVGGIEKLVNDEQVDVMMTGYASPTNFEIKNMAEIDMPYLISANSAQTEQIIGTNGDDFPTVWSLVPSYKAYETDLPPLIEQWESDGKLELKSKKVAIISSDNPYSKTISEGLKTTFQDMGWTITVDELVPFGEVLDWRAIIAKIKADPPDVVVNTDYLPANGASFMNQFLEDPTDSLVFIQYGPSVPEFVELTKDNSTGVLYNLLGGVIMSDDNQAYLDFKEAWEAEYGKEGGLYGEALWESVYIYAEALQEVGDPKDHLAVGKAIGQISYVGPRGTVEFDQATHLAKQGDDYIPIQFYQIWEGGRVLLTPPQFATGEFQLPPWMQ